MANFDDYTLYLNEISTDFLDDLNALSVKEFSDKQVMTSIYLEVLHH